MVGKKSDDSGLVWSSEHGRMCPDCGKPIGACTCAKGQSHVAGDGIVRVRRETKGRKGKTVTTITGVALASADLKALAKDLKKKCGSGGALTGGVIEIQGDHRATVLKELQARGFTVKLAGG